MPKIKKQSVKEETQLERLHKLKAKLVEAKEQNHKEVVEEYKKTKQNPKDVSKMDRKRRKAEILKERLEADEKGIDYERERWWDYTAESAENYELKQKDKEERSNLGFTDYNQIAQKKYNKIARQIKPNMENYVYDKNNKPHAYQDGKLDLLSLNNLDNRPTAEAVDRLVKHVEKEQEGREKSSRIRKFKEDDEINYINDRNMRFNKKIARAYDKYTEEIRESFERGTAL